ncbi:hypothetical protein AZE42_08420 [Rhizopogon vesiculosus]|uniref:Uncharacterized protein n=1 Tax=Rhizopogon vesiculosus TaxID=180088 RepID=A0A1J8R2D8_9AGAM|nr:hypothetical protein AZE42_08420 [Rhizopogon vesiculosus]
MLVENKPARPKRMRKFLGSPYIVIEDQTRRQAMFAFASDPTLNTLGVIIALGDRWQYSEIRRSANLLLSSWSEKKDPTFAVKVRTQKFVVPAYLKRLSGNDTFSFELMDRSGKSAVAFKFIADRIKARESDFWGLPLPKPIKQ